MISCELGKEGSTGIHIIRTYPIYLLTVTQYTHTQTHTRGGGGGGGGGGEGLLEKAKTNHVLNKTDVSYLHLPLLCFIAYTTRPMQPQPESSLIAIVNDESEDLTM